MKDTHNYRYWQKMTSEKLRKKVKQLFKLFEANKISNDEYEIIFNLIDDELNERNYGKLFFAICRYCKLPKGYNLTKYASNFAWDILKNDELYSLTSEEYEISSYYTKTKRPLIVEF